MRRFSVILIVCGLVVSSSLVRESSATKRTEVGNSFAQNPPRDERLWQRALAIHRRAIVIDTHNDITTGKILPENVTVVEAHFDLEAEDQDAAPAEFKDSMYVCGRNLNNRLWHRLGMALARPDPRQTGVGPPRDGCPRTEVARQPDRHP